MNDLLILHASEKYVLLVTIRVEFDDIGYLAVGEGLYTLPGLRVPQFDVSVERSGEKLCALVVERYIFDRLRMAEKGSEAVAVVVHVP